MANKDKKYLSEEEHSKSRDKGDFSFIVFLLYLMGILTIIGGIFQGMRLVKEARILDDPFVRYIAMGFLGGGIICGIFFIGIGRNIALLRDINNKLDEL